MHKTDVDDIKSNGAGILVNTSKDSSYEQLRKKHIEEARQRDRINRLEEDVSSIKDLLNKILKQVS